MTTPVRIIVEAAYGYTNVEGVGENARQAVEHALRVRGFKDVSARLELVAEPRVVTVEVAVDCYRKGYAGTMLRHSWKENESTTLCGRIGENCLAELDEAVTGTEPTCAGCLRKDRRFTAATGRKEGSSK